MTEKNFGNFITCTAALLVASLISSIIDSNFEFLTKLSGGSIGGVSLLTPLTLLLLIGCFTVGKSRGLYSGGLVGALPSVLLSLGYAAPLVHNGFAAEAISLVVAVLISHHTGAYIRLLKYRDSKETLTLKVETYNTVCFVLAIGSISYSSNILLNETMLQTTLLGNVALCIAVTTLLCFSERIPTTPLRPGESAAYLLITSITAGWVLGASILAILLEIDLIAASLAIAHVVGIFFLLVRNFNSRYFTESYSGHT